MKRQLAVALLFGTPLIVAAIHNVPTSPTKEDVAAVRQMLSGHVPQMPASYDEQLDVIAAVQDAVLSTAPIDQGIPPGLTREPADLLNHRLGLCYDRSRSIEKALRVIGFEARHVSIFTTEGRSTLITLASHTSSHALTEVKTAKGWLAVDSNVRWLALDEHDLPVPLELTPETPIWSSRVSDPLPLLQEDFVAVRGLYSRHGRFYPPMTPIPDVSWPELLRHN